MAAGLSVITTDQGAVADFTSAKTVWQVQSEFVPCTSFPCRIDNTTGRNVPTLFGLPTKRMPRWLNYSTTELGDTMRKPWQAPAQAREKAELARAYVVTQMQWSTVGKIIRDRIDAVNRS